MLKIVQVGLGPLGQKIVGYLLERGGLELVAAIDIDPQKTGRDVGELIGGAPIGVKVARDLASGLGQQRADVAILATVSGLDKILPQITSLAQAGLNIVSTCEELSCPWRTNPGLAADIDRICRDNNVACVGTGVNPGFLMDYLPSVLSAVCQDVTRISVERIQDASSRRIPFQEKIGAGLTLDQFAEKVSGGSLRHVGLVESVQLIAGCFNWELDQVTETLEPVMAETEITTGFRPIEAGQACGVEQIGSGWLNGKEVIRLRFRAAVGEPDPVDSIEISGNPGFKSSIPGGVQGDVATCAITVNALRAIGNAGPGLKTMLDIPVPGYFKSL
ncbi:MAG: dihydrodipicolinate reductase [Candidatus Neomarinimicrobiota bacterium]